MSLSELATLIEYRGVARADYAIRHRDIANLDRAKQYWKICTHEYISCETVASLEVTLAYANATYIIVQTIKRQTPIILLKRRTEEVNDGQPRA
jgi:hypothetical protein